MAGLDARLSPAARQAPQRQFLGSRPSQRPLPQAWFSKQRRIERVKSRQERLVDTLCLPSNVLQTADFPQQLTHVRRGIALQRSYRDKGFFNGGVTANELLGAGGERLEIFFGDQIQRIWGTINRTATTNKTPPYLRRQGAAAALPGAA